MKSNSCQEESQEAQNVYEKWLCRNRAVVKSVEEVARMASYLIPDRYGALEMKVEAANCLLRVFTSTTNFVFLRMDHLKAFDTANLKVSVPYIGEFKQAIQGRECLTDVTLCHSQLLIEMIALKYFGDAKRWRIVLIIELIKAWFHVRQFLRQVHFQNRESNKKNSNSKKQNQNPFFFIHATTWLSLLALRVSSTKSRKWKSPTSRDQKPTATCSTKQRDLLIQKMIGTKETSIKSQDVYSAKQTQQINGINESETSLTTKSEELNKNSTLNMKEELTLLIQILSNPKDKEYLPELVYLIRPVFYVILILKYGKQSWIPWIVSLSSEFWAFDAFGKRVNNHITTETKLVTPTPTSSSSSSPTATLTSPLELNLDSEQNLVDAAIKAEKARRFQEVLSYLLRSPLLHHVTRPLFAGMSTRLEWIPLMGSLLSQVPDLLESMDKHHFYTSVS